MYRMHGERETLQLQLWSHLHPFIKIVAQCDGFIFGEERMEDHVQIESCCSLLTIGKLKAE